MTLLLRSSPGSLAAWREALALVLPEREVRVWPDIGDPADIDYAIVWQPERGLLAGLPRLKLILSLGAGVDHLLGDPDLPRHLPIVRLVDPHMTDAMSEYVVFQVLRLHLQDIDYRAQQAARIWRERGQKNAAQRRVGILGFGTLGQDAARKLTAIGFDVAGWSRHPKCLPGVATHAGAAGLDDFLAPSEILVCLLPLTAETAGILNAGTFARLPRGAGLVNAGRGSHLVEGDLLAALDGGRLSAAVLDVFADEPLPPEHPFWSHPRIVVTPHVAAATHAPTAAAVIAETIARFEAGLALANRIDPALGY